MLDAINTKNERNNESSLPNWISHFSCPYFPKNPCFSLNKLALQFFKKETYQEKFKKRKPCSFHD